MITSSESVIPFGFDLPRGYQGRAQMCCPICCFEYVHLTQVRVESNSRLVVVDNGSIRSYASPSRSSCHVYLVGYCEDGHDFEVELYSHKGMMLLRTIGGEPETPEEGRPLDLEHLIRSAGG